MLRRILLALVLVLLLFYAAACHSELTDVDEGAGCSIILTKEDGKDTAGVISSDEKELFLEGLERDGNGTPNRLFGTTFFP